jgi:hypothetical protein
MVWTLSNEITFTVINQKKLLTDEAAKLAAKYPVEKASVREKFYYCHFNLTAFDSGPQISDQ